MIANSRLFDNPQPPLPIFNAHPSFVPLIRPDLSQLARQRDRLPALVRYCQTSQRYLDLLGPLDWGQFPNRDPARPWPGPIPHPRAAYVAAFLVKINEGLPTMPALHRFLRERPALVWILGFHLVADDSTPWGFDPIASLPTARHFGRVLRECPNECLQFLLSCTVTCLQGALPETLTLGEEISLDTKVILAWVKENNPKVFLKNSDRLDKTRQPKGDPDCKLGCKKKANTPPPSAQDPDKRQAKSNFSATDVYYWGYASGVVASKIPDWGEFVLAELTQTFDRNDVTYFFPLMADVEARLGFAPPYGALDAAYDTFYVHDYFDQAGGFAAVPFVQRGGFSFAFDDAGLPLCQAGLAMPLKSTFICHTTEYDHERGRYVCPLRYPDATQQPCPIAHANDAKNGCITTLATSKGARLRYQLDRDSEAYHKRYQQRTATERINAQAKDLGIESPKLRNQGSISNHNTLIYVIINLRAVARVQAKKAQQAATPDPSSVA